MSGHVGTLGGIRSGASNPRSYSIFLLWATISSRLDVMTIEKKFVRIDRPCESRDIILDGKYEYSLHYKWTAVSITYQFIRGVHTKLV